jgi:hypothetical protein
VILLGSRSHACPLAFSDVLEYISKQFEIILERQM